MGQQANSGRNASLDQKKDRAAGRTGRTGQRATGASGGGAAKGKVDGAFGKDGMANRPPSARRPHSAGEVRP